MRARFFVDLIPRALAIGLLLMTVIRSCPASNYIVSNSMQQQQIVCVTPFDEYGSITWEDEQARLDNFAIQLQNDSTTKGYIIIYIGKDDLPGRTPERLVRPYEYLINSRGISADRLVNVNGGYREKQATTLWIAPKDAPAPEPTGTITVNKETGKTFKFDEEYLEFFDGVNQSAGDTENDALTANAGNQASTPDTEKQSNQSQGTPEDANLSWASEQYAKALQEEKESQAYIIFYADHDQADYSKVQAIVERGKKMLAEKYKLDAASIVAMFGGWRKYAMLELWVVPPGASLPTPSFDPQDINDSDHLTPQAEDQTVTVP